MVQPVSYVPVVGRMLITSGCPTALRAINAPSHICFTPSSHTAHAKTRRGSGLKPTGGLDRVRFRLRLRRLSEQGLASGCAAARLARYTQPITEEDARPRPWIGCNLTTASGRDSNSTVGPRWGERGKHLNAECMVPTCPSLLSYAAVRLRQAPEQAFRSSPLPATGTVPIARTGR
jgi:hypothetical protein